MDAISVVECIVFFNTLGIIIPFIKKAFNRRKKLWVALVVIVAVLGGGMGEYFSFSLQQIMGSNEFRILRRWIIPFGIFVQYLLIFKLC